MKKILLAVMAIAAIGFTSCGNKTQQAEATDSTEVAINPEEEANAVVDNLKAFVAAGDADQLAACLDKVKETVNKFAISDSVAAKAYAAAVQKYLIENAEQVKAIAQQNATTAAVITTLIETKPENIVNAFVENAANKAEATKDAAATAAEATKDAAVEAVNQQVEDAKAAANQKAEETKAAAKQKANEAVDNAAQNLKKGLGL